MSVRPIDTFITNSVKLFEANPSQATISITYAHNPEQEKTRVTFRTSNPHLNSTYKFATNKSKDVSRLLNALGPRGVTLNPGRIEKQVLKKQSKSINKKKKRNKSISVVGIGCLIANTRVKQVKPVHTEKKPVKAAGTGSENNKSSSEPPLTSVSKKQNKGKGKNKGKSKSKGKR